MLVLMLVQLGDGGGRDGGNGGDGGDGGDDGESFGSVVTASNPGGGGGELDGLQYLRLALGDGLLLKLLQVLRLDLDDLRLSGQLAGVGHLDGRDVRLLLLLLLISARRPFFLDRNSVHVDAGKSSGVRDDRVACGVLEGNERGYV